MSTDGVVSKKASLARHEAQTEKKKKKKKKKMKMSESRRWEEMDMDCLANAFSKAGMESLFLALPFVCKSWYKATLSPMCWKCLIFPDHTPSHLFVDSIEETVIPPHSFGTFYDRFIDQYGIDKTRFSITSFVKMVVDRSQGQATILKLPMCGTEAALRYVSDACPLLEHLLFADDLAIFKHYQILPEVIGKWKFLESFILGGTYLFISQQLGIVDEYHFSKYFQELVIQEMESPSCCDDVLERTIVQIGTHCKHFRKLCLVLTHLRQVEALAIVNFLPHVTTISAFRCIIEKDSLLTIARGCKQPWVFHAKECAGFEEDDEEIYKLGGKAGKIVCEDCKLHDRLLVLLNIHVPTLLKQLVMSKMGMQGQ